MDVRREGPRNVRVCAESGDLNECPQQDELNRASQCLISRRHRNDRIARVDGDTIYRGGSYDKFSYDWYQCISGAGRISGKRRFRQALSDAFLRDQLRNLVLC